MTQGPCNGRCWRRLDHKLIPRRGRTAVAEYARAIINGRSGLKIARLDVQTTCAARELASPIVLHSDFIVVASCSICTALRRIRAKDTNSVESHRNLRLITTNAERKHLVVDLA